MASVRDFLDGSSVARATATLDLGGGRGITIWENHLDRVRYERPEGHVFSLYLQGGSGTRRVDRLSRPGFAGAVCIFPEGATSEWEIRAPFRFVHLYLPDARLRAQFAEIHECDARLLDLEDVTFAADSGLAAPLRALADSAAGGQSLRAETAVAELVAQLRPGRTRLRGGLAPHLFRRLAEKIESDLDQDLSLAELAELVDLSPFHLHRMFRASRGMALHAWITARRIERAKTLLSGPLPLIEVALACGFSSQSHFTRCFKAQTSCTPAQWRLQAAPRHREGGP